jgi:hypothetical protein
VSRLVGSEMCIRDSGCIDSLPLLIEVLRILKRVSQETLFC